MTYKISLALSLMLNAALIGAFFLGPDRQSATGDVPRHEPLSSVRRPNITSEPEQTSTANKASPSRSSTTEPAWQQSLPQLRAAGVPNEVLAGLVIADFEIGWQKQLREFEQRYQSGAVDDDERARFEARRDDEQERALRAALGDEGFRQWDKAYSLRDLDLAKLQLSSSEADSLYQLRKDRALKDRMLAEALRNGEIDEADYNEQQSAAQQEYDRQFKMLLGDERYEGLQNLEEGMEGALRQQVRDLNLVDSQFEAMLAAERKWNRQRADSQALDAARDQEYEQLLGTQGFEQLQKNQDSRYRLLRRHANTWSLSDSDIDFVYGTLRQYPERSPHARDQIEQSLLSYLGPERFARLKNNDLFDLGEP